LTRDKFEEICQPFFDKLLPPVTKALKDAKIKKAAIDEIVMVGGCTHIPQIRKII
jgi:molecular chaperone DnaK (HSP70)